MTAAGDGHTRFFRRWSLSVITGFGVLALALAAMVMLFIGEQNNRAEAARLAVESARLAKEAECQRVFNEQFKTALGERQAASAKDRMAQRQLNQGTLGMLRVILDPQSTTDQRRVAVQSWQQAVIEYDRQIVEAEETRQDNPLPDGVKC